MTFTVTTFYVHMISSMAYDTSLYFSQPFLTPYWRFLCARTFFLYRVLEVNNLRVVRTTSRITYIQNILYTQFFVRVLHTPSILCINNNEILSHKSDTNSLIVYLAHAIRSMCSVTV